MDIKYPTHTTTSTLKRINKKHPISLPPWKDTTKISIYKKQQNYWTFSLHRIESKLCFRNVSRNVYLFKSMKKMCAKNKKFIREIESVFAEFYTWKFPIVRSSPRQEMWSINVSKIINQFECSSITLHFVSHTF
jgi:hypothetical protein